MSGRVSPLTTLKLYSGVQGARTERTFYGAMPVSGPRTGAGGSAEWITKIWASPSHDHTEALQSATTAAAAAEGGHFTLLGSSFAGLHATLFILGEGTIPVAATRMHIGPPDSAGPEQSSVPVVTEVLAWTDINLMNQSEQADFARASHP